MVMEKKKCLAFTTVTVFVSMMLLVSCGKNKEGAITSERNVPDSALTDSIKPSGDYEFQNDQVPEGTTEQLDSIPDSTGRKRH
jgi:hypothetical protein